MKTTVTDEPDVVSDDFKRWHKLVVDAAPIRKQQTKPKTKIIVSQKSVVDLCPKKQRFCVAAVEALYVPREHNSH